MTWALAARLKRLEQRSEPPPLPESNVVYFDAPTDEILTPLPKNKKIMLVPRWPDNEAWETALREQQDRLIASAGK